MTAARGEAAAGRGGGGCPGRCHSPESEEGGPTWLSRDTLPRRPPSPAAAFSPPLYGEAALSPKGANTDIHRVTPTLQHRRTKSQEAVSRRSQVPKKFSSRISQPIQGWRKVDDWPRNLRDAAPANRVPSSPKATRRVGLRSPPSPCVYLRRVLGSPGQTGVGGTRFTTSLPGSAKSRPGSTLCLTRGVGGGRRGSLPQDTPFPAARPGGGRS